MMPWCLTENNYIRTINGFELVENLFDGTKVINKNVEEKAITKIGKRFLAEDERVLSFRAKSVPIEIEVTNKHSLYIVKDLEIIKVRAEDINVGDYMFVPKPKLSDSLPNIDLSKYALSGNWDENSGRIVYGREANKSEGVYIKPKICEELFYLAGLYLAEGCVYKSDSCVSFSFNINEYNTIAADCKSAINKVFGLSDSHIYERFYEDRAGCELIVNNVLIGKFFEAEFGTGAGNKYINNSWFCNNAPFRKALLKGYWDGDGHISYRHSYNNPECTATTKSLNLCMSIREMLLSFNIVPSITKNTRNDGRVSYITSVSSATMDEILDIKGANRKPNNFFDFGIDNGFAVRVTNKKEMGDYSGIIYSVAVEPGEGEDINGSYILNGIASSNSPWYRLEQYWAEASQKHGAELMRYVYENQEEAKQTGLKLQSHLKENFNYEDIGSKILDAIRSL